MENINDIKIKLIQKICESDNYYLLSAFLKNFESKSPYFKEEEIKLPAEILEILNISEEQINNGQTFTNEEVNAYFEEWLKD